MKEGSMLGWTVAAIIVVVVVSAVMLQGFVRPLQNSVFGFLDTLGIGTKCEAPGIWIPKINRIIAEGKASEAESELQAFAECHGKSPPDSLIALAELYSKRNIMGGVLKVLSEYIIAYPDDKKTLSFQSLIEGYVYIDAIRFNFKTNYVYPISTEGLPHKTYSDAIRKLKLFDKKHSELLYATANFYLGDAYYYNTLNSQEDFKLLFTDGLSAYEKAKLNPGLSNGLEQRKLIIEFPYLPQEDKLGNVVFSSLGDKYKGTVLYFWVRWYEAKDNKKTNPDNALQLNKAIYEELKKEYLDTNKLGDELKKDLLYEISLIEGQLAVKESLGKRDYESAMRDSNKYNVIDLKEPLANLVKAIELINQGKNVDAIEILLKIPMEGLLRDHVDFWLGVAYAKNRDILALKYLRKFVSGDSSFSADSLLWLGDLYRQGPVNRDGSAEYIMVDLQPSAIDYYRRFLKCL